MYLIYLMLLSSDISYEIHNNQNLNFYKHI